MPRVCSKYLIQPVHLYQLSNNITMDLKTLKGPSKIAADNILIFHFYLSKKKGLIFHVNSLETSSLVFSEKQ